MTFLALRRTAGAVALASAVIFGAGTAMAQEVTLRMHHFLPPQATVPAKFLVPWAEKVEADSGGRIKIDVFPAMQLGGKPPELIDQAKDGVADIVWTLPGYTPGRFPRVEVFELPFTMTTAEATSKAYSELFEAEMKDADFKDFKIIATWVHGPGMFHMKGDGIRSLDDMSGKKLRGPTRVINGLLGELGATAIGMPVPAIPEALSKGVIDGTVIPWEVTSALKIPELTNTHTNFSGDKALYTAAFVLAMNKQKYDSLPDDLKAVIDANSGVEVSGQAGKIMEDADAPARQIAVDAGNTIVTLDDAETTRWQEAAKPVTERWLEEMSGKGIDGAGLLAKANELIAKHTQ